jgi:hypothetical protein
MVLTVEQMLGASEPMIAHKSMIARKSTLVFHRSMQVNIAPPFPKLV